jgi:hypothetical protein
LGQRLRRLKSSGSLRTAGGCLQRVVHVMWYWDGVLCAAVVERLVFLWSKGDLQACFRARRILGGQVLQMVCGRLRG